MADLGAKEDRGRTARRRLGGMVKGVPQQHCAALQPLIDCCVQCGGLGTYFRVSPHARTAYN